MFTSPTVLMCPPDFFGIEYEINPWMNRRRQCDHELAERQWRELHHLLERAGVNVLTVRPVAGLPDFVFTANAALVFRDTAIMSRFRPCQRRGEEPHNRLWLLEHGFRICDLPSGAFFEGAGDALFLGDVLFAGYRIRSEIRADQEVAAMIGCRVIPLELVDEYFYHLDTCFCPLAPGKAIYYPDAFDSYARRVLADLVDDLIPTSAEEARRLACNAIVVGGTVITNTGCPELHEQLRIRGFDHYETPLDEFVKAGGAAKCLTLRLDGEDAAAWRAERRTAERVEVAEK